MNVAFSDKGWRVYAVFPFTDEFGIGVVQHDAGQCGFVRHNQLDVLRLVDLVRSGQAWVIGVQAQGQPAQKHFQFHGWLYSTGQLL